MSDPINELVAGFQDLVAQVPDIVQPLILALAGAVPFIEGEGAAMIGVIGGVNPFLAAAAGVTGNLISVILVVLLSSRIRTAATSRRSAKAGRMPTAAGGVPKGVAAAGGASSPAATAGGASSPAAIAGGASSPAAIGTLTFESEADLANVKPESKGKQKLKRWLVRFGVPGASLLAPLALPTHFTAATLVGSGIPKGRVIFWQAVAIVLWASLLTAVATGVLAGFTG
jgi:hypothetical protein